MIQKLKDLKVYVRPYDLARHTCLKIEGLSSRLTKRLLVIFLLIFLLQPLASTISQAQNLEAYLQMAGENNPELKAYFNDYLAALERIPQLGALPDPELSMGIFLKPMERFMGNQQADIQLMQMFPWFGTLGARKDEAAKMALAKQEVFQDAKNRLFYQVKETWYRLYQLEEEVRITEEHLKILQTYERLALVRYQSADGSGNRDSGMSDVLRVRIEIKTLENQLVFLKDSRLPLQAEFNQLLNRDPDEPIRRAGGLEAIGPSDDRLAVLDSVTQNNPMLKMLDAEKEAYGLQKKTARLEGRPTFGAGVNYMAFSPRTDAGMPMGGMDMVMPMVSVTIPIYRKKYKALSREAELKQEAVGQRREYLASQLTTQWTVSLRDLDDARRKAQLYREQTDLVGQTLNLLMTSYSASGQDFEEILRVQQQLLDYQLALVTSIVDQHSAVAMLEMLGGGDLLM